ncbi:hypothetical protein RUM44_004122 [Polyplax serrata]|uniref:Ammonium transporter AmtB-like domain-containing protein n=1 Tax=Polyplax serrata TaxID=468196 RepID=A0ABR1B1Y8_POLSC
MDDFYHADTEESLSLGPDFFDASEQNSDPAIYLKVSSVLFVRAGLFLAHVSSIPSSNIQILIFQNIIDIAVNTVVYALLGNLFAFGKDIGTFIGIDGFLGDKTNRNDFAEGWLVIIAVSGLLVAAIGDRISFFASLILNLLISGFVFPILIHWILSESGWMRINAFTNARVSYKDYSYSCLVHMCGGFVALISMLIMNKRLLRFKDMDVCSIPDNGPSLTLFGNFFILIGFFGIGVPTQKYINRHLHDDFYGIVLVNMILAAFGSIASTLLMTFSCPSEPMHKWTSMRSIQAGISGIAVVAGGADIYHPVPALVMGLFNGIMFFFASLVVTNSSIEDYSNIIACHFASGVIGTLLPPIFGMREGFSTSLHYTLIHFTWQLIGDFAVLAFISCFFIPITFILDYLSILRSWDEDINHRRALYAAKTLKNEPGYGHATSTQNTEDTVRYLQTEYNKPVPPYERLHYGPETLDILFDKNVDSSVNSTEPRSYNCVAPCSSNEKPSPRQYDKEKMTKQQFIVNYMVNSKPMTFFEEVVKESNQNSETLVREYGDGMKNSRFIDIRLIKGIRNISDSKLFQKFKDNLTTPKRKSVWSRPRELRLGSMSNIFVPNYPRTSLETQV